MSVAETAGTERSGGPAGSAVAWTLLGGLLIAAPAVVATVQGHMTPLTALVVFLVAESALWLLGAIGYGVMDLLDRPAPDAARHGLDDAAAGDPATAVGGSGAPDLEG